MAQIKVIVALDKLMVGAGDPEGFAVDIFGFRSKRQVEVSAAIVIEIRIGVRRDRERKSSP